MTIRVCSSGSERQILGRWHLGVLMALGVALTYLDRVNISHAIVPIANELGLSPVYQGLILSAFSFGYVSFMLAGGFVVDRIGPVLAPSIAAAAWSIATFWTGVSGSGGTLLMSRVLVGAGEAPIFPANARLVREHFPLNQRGRATALFDAGSYVGIAISAPVVVYVIMWLGWRWAFFACASAGFVWVFFWTRCTKNLRNAGGQVSSKALVDANWHSFGRLLTNRTILVIGAGFFCYNYTKSFFLTWFPTYLVSEGRFPFGSVGYLGLVPPLLAIAAEGLAGWSTDWLIQHGASVTVARKLPLCTALLATGIGLMLAPLMSRWGAFIVLSLSFASNIAASPGIWSIPGDIAPRPTLVATVGGIQNTFSNVAGIVAPIVNGTLLAFGNNFRLALAVSGCVALLRSLCYGYFLGSLRPVELTVKDSETC